MARTRAIDFDDKQQLILDTAADLFASRGFASTSINEVAVACGASKSWLYHYHKSKEAILFAILSTHIKEILVRAVEVFDEADPPEKRFRKFLHEIMDIYAEARSKHVVLLNDIGNLPQQQQDEIRALERRMVEHLIRLLRDLNPALLDERQAQKVYAMLFYGMVNWTYTWFDQKGPLAPGELADRIGDLFLNGFIGLSAANGKPAASAA